jgi:hypothetical protein
MSKQLLKALDEAKDDRQHFLTCLKEIRLKDKEKPSEGTLKMFKASDIRNEERHDELKTLINISSGWMKWAFAIFTVVVSIAGTVSYFADRSDFKDFKSESAIVNAAQDVEIEEIKKRVLTLES